MSIRGLLTGFAIAGAATVAYNQKIYSTSDTLRRALTSLSKDLDSFRVQSQSDKALAAPQAWESLALAEQVKLQWNDQLLRGVHALYAMQWSGVAKRTWNSAKTEAQALQKRLS